MPSGSDQLLSSLVRRRRKDLSLSPSEEEKERIVNRVMSDFFNAHGSNKSFRENHVEFYRNWRGTVDPIENGPLGARSANVRVPLTSTFIEQWKSRLIKVLIGDEKIVEFQSLDETLSPDHIGELNDWFNWELTNIIDLEAILNDILHYALVDGIALPIPTYDRDYRVLRSTREFFIAEGIPIEDQITQALIIIFASDKVTDEPEEIGDGIYRIRIKDEPPAKVTFLIEDESLIAEIERREVMFDGVRITNPNLEDIVVVNSHEDIEKLHFFGTRFFISVNEFRAMTEKDQMFGGISPEDKEIILSMATDRRGEFIPQPTTDEGDAEEGTNSRDSLYSNADPDRSWIEIYRWESNITVGKDRNVGAVAWIAARARKLLKVMRLEELNKDGRRSPVKFDFIRQPGRFYSIGLAEWLRHSQTEIDGIHNFRLNSGLVATVPFGFYVPAAGQPKDILQLEPGKMYPIRDKDSIVFPKMQWNAVWGFQEEALTRKYASEHAGIGDPGAGTFTSKRISATEFMGTATAIDLQTERIAKGFMRSLSDLLYRIFGLYQQHARDGRIFQVSDLDGTTIIKRLSRDRLHGKVLLRLTGNVRNMSVQVERELAVNMLSLLMNQILIQIGIVREDTIYEMIKKVSKTMNIQGVPLYKPDVPPKSAPPDEEHKAMMRGEPVTPSPTENFTEHITVHGKLVSDPRFEELVPDPIVRALMAQHLQVTLQLQQQVILQRQIMAAQAAGMQLNMERMGVRPGLAGSQEPGGQAQPGTAEEGVATGATEQIGGTPQ